MRLPIWRPVKPLPAKFPNEADLIAADIARTADEKTGD